MRTDPRKDSSSDGIGLYTFYLTPRHRRPRSEPAAYRVSHVCSHKAAPRAGHPPDPFLLFALLTWKLVGSDKRDRAAAHRQKLLVSPLIGPGAP